MTAAATASSQTNGVCGFRFGWQASLLLAVAIAFAGSGIAWLIPSELILSLMVIALINALLATGIGWLIRQNGLVSFGHAAFFGMGAYLVALNDKFGWMPAELMIVLAILASAIFAFVIGLLIVRLPVITFAMITLAVAQALHELMMRWRAFAGGDDGLSIRFPDTLFGVDIRLFQDPREMFVVCWVVLILVLFILALMARSHFGTLTMAIRDNEERARYIGYPTLWPRASIFAMSAAIAALAGVLFALYNGFVSPDVLHWTLSGEALIMAIIGGSGLVWGAALGAVVFFVIKDTGGNYTEHWPALIGIVLIVVTVTIPRGLSELIRRATRGRIGGRA